MRPGKRNPDKGNREQQRRNQMAEREPPAGQQQPDQIADEAKETAAGICQTKVGVQSLNEAAENLKAIA